MLVLSRGRDEVLMIGDDVQVTVVDIRGDKVRLGITAPSQIPVHRKEVYEAIQRENRAASGATLDDILEREKRRPSNVTRLPGGEAVVTCFDVRVPPGTVRLEGVAGGKAVIQEIVNCGADAPGGAAPVPPSPLDPTTGV